MISSVWLAALSGCFFHGCGVVLFIYYLFIVSHHPAVVVPDPDAELRVPLVSLVERCTPHRVMASSRASSQADKKRQATRHQRPTRDCLSLSSKIKVTLNLSVLWLSPWGILLIASLWRVKRFFKTVFCILNLIRIDQRREGAKPKRHI